MFWIVLQSRKYKIANFYSVFIDSRKTRKKNIKNKNFMTRKIYIKIDFL